MHSVLFLERAVSVSLHAGLIVALTHWLCRVATDERSRCRLWFVCTLLLLGDVLAALLLPQARLLHPWATVSPATVSSLFVVERQIGWTLGIIWLTGVLGAAGLFAWRTARMIGFLRTCHPLDEQLLPPLDSEQQSEKRTAGTPLVLSSPEVPAPFCWQFHRPCIVLPQDVLQLDDRSLRFILRHESEHLRTGHPAQLFLQRLAEFLFWFHPMVWWASRQAALSREFLCDEAAIRDRCDIAAYLRTLLALVERLESTRETGGVALSFGGRAHMLAARSERLVRLAGDNHRSKQRGGLRSRLCLTLLGFLLPGTLLVSVPVNVTASPRSIWSPWPHWSAVALHDFGISVRDFEAYDPRLEVQDLLDHHSVSRITARSPR